MELRASLSFASCAVTTASSSEAAQRSLDYAGWHVPTAVMSSSLRSARRFWTAPPNHQGAENPAMTLQLTVESQWRRVSDSGRLSSAFAGHAFWSRVPELDRPMKSDGSHGGAKARGCRRMLNYGEAFMREGITRTINGTLDSDSPCLGASVREELIEQADRVNPRDDGSVPNLQRVARGQ